MESIHRHSYYEEGDHMSSNRKEPDLSDYRIGAGLYIVLLSMAIISGTSYLAMLNALESRTLTLGTPFVPVVVFVVLLAAIVSVIGAVAMVLDGLTRLTHRQ